ncbi:MAG TPA: hypothetical protein VMZ92_10060 [Planctomycetota bacterium]|nr:hypothetical protein [Planctomycetota bacterium]
MSGRCVVALLLVALVTSGCPDEAAVARYRDEEIARRLDELEKTARLRDQKLLAIEAQVAAVHADKKELEVLLKETKDIVTQLEKQGGVPAEKPFAFEPTRVDFSFLTCAIDTDGKKGDDAIAAYVSLYDQFDTVLKAAGDFHFELFDLARPAGHVIQSWSFKPEEAARWWQRFPACYQFRLPFGGKVLAEKVFLKVTFRQAGKKELTTTRELTVELQ